MQQTVGSIGYVEYAYAMQSKLVYTDMINAAGKRVHPTMEAFQSAAANADFTKVQDFYEILTNQPGAQSWPITAATYMLMRADYPADKNKAMLKFLDWALQERPGRRQEAGLCADARRRREADRSFLGQDPARHAVKAASKE